jgi:hypothetical protein
MPDLTAGEKAELFEGLNYLNLQEIRRLCTRHAIPYRVYVQHADGRLTATKDTDRKPIVLARVRHFLSTGDPGQPTCVTSGIVRPGSPPTHLDATDRIYYRWYAKEHEGLIGALKGLTGGRFVDGAVARVLIMDYWMRGEAPTLAEFAQAWTQAKAEEHKLLTPEYAHLTDLQRGAADEDWKALRNAKARAVLAKLDDLLETKPAS